VGTRKQQAFFSHLVLSVYFIYHFKVMAQDIPGLPELLTYFENNGITVCILYGSAASERHISKSDIDLSIAADEPLKPETLVTHYVKAVDFLHREVDLSDLRAAKGLFLKEILTKGEVLLNRDPEFLGKKAIEMMDYQTDLAPAVNSMLKARLEAVLNEK
jgi:predicted nucleotidyltransferase